MAGVTNITIFLIPKVKMEMFTCVIYMFFIINIYCINTPDQTEIQLEFANKKALSQGQHYFEELKLRTGLPTYGICWQEALFNLQNGCKFLTETVQQKLAFQFAKCFLESSGRGVIECEDNPMEQCLAKLDPVAFSAYQTYFVHTQSICFYLKSELWQEQTENTIKKLSSTAFQLAQQLESSNNLQREILNLQSDSIKSQNKILDQGQLIGQSLEESHRKAHDAFEQFEKTTKEQKAVINRVFDRIVDLQSSVFGMFSGLDSFIFYIIAFVISYLLTSQSRTSSARIWLLLLWASSMIVENRMKPEQIVDFTGEIKIIRESWLFYFRCCMITLAIIILFHHYARYKDYSYLNWKVADDVSRNVLLLTQRFDGLSGRIDQLSYKERPMLNYPISYDYDNSDSSDCTFNSSLESDNDSESEDDSFATSLSVMDNDVNSSRSHHSSLSSLNSSTISQSMESSSIVSCYNLRSKNKIASPCQINIFKLNESPKTFGKLIHTLSKQSRAVGKTISKNRKQWKDQQMHFSDDDGI